MDLESLKEKVMRQAAEKGFGITPAEINLAEKLLLIGSEGVEAKEAVTKCSTALCDLSTICQTNPSEEYLSQLRSTPFQEIPGIRSATSAADSLKHSEAEWGDVLQRVLHLGGCYGIIFPTQIPNVPIYSKIDDNERFAQVYELAITAYIHYRKIPKEPERKALFENTLVNLALYCVNVSLQDGFSISQVILDKIEENKKRTWDPQQYNEHFIEKRLP